MERGADCLSLYLNLTDFMLLWFSRSSVPFCCDPNRVSESIKEKCSVGSAAHRNTSAKHIPSTHPLNTSPEHIHWTTHPLNTAPKHIHWTHPLNNKSTEHIHWMPTSPEHIHWTPHPLNTSTVGNCLGLTINLTQTLFGSDQCYTQSEWLNAVKELSF